MTDTTGGHPAVVRVGARSPLGLNAVQTAMSWRAGNFEPRRTPLLDRREQPVGMARARFLPDDLYGIDRLVALGAPALAEAASGLRAPVPLVLGLCEPGRPDDDPRFDGPVIGELATHSGVSIDRADSLVVRNGHASFAFALEHAVRLLSMGVPAALVGAVDSYYHPDVVAWLDEGYRLHAPGAENGIIPSEGGAFVLLTQAALEKRAGEQLFGPAAPRAMATLRHVATARDEEALDPEAPLLATVMTNLVRDAAESLPGPVEWLLSDVSCEFHRIREWGRVLIRNQLAGSQAGRGRLPDDMGECGAATGALALAFASVLWDAGCAPAADALIALHSEGAERAVFLARGVQPQRPGAEATPTSAVEGSTA